jgi:hypothetical protein
MTTKETPTPTMYVEMVASEYGTPEPSLRVDLGEAVSQRQLRAALHLLAAHAELLSGKERWLVQTRPHDMYWHKGRVYLELDKGDAAEAERGMAFLLGLMQQQEAAVVAAAGRVK